MDLREAARPLRPGDAAPDFMIPAITRDGAVGLRDYRGSPVLLGLFRGVYCPFCRRHIAMLDAIGRKLGGKGIATLAIVTSPAERARLYFRYRPTAMTVASDPEMSVHRAFGLPASEVTEGRMNWPYTINLGEAGAVLTDAGGELEEPVPMAAAGKLLDRKDGFTYEAGDSEDAERSWNQLGGLFLIDAAGLVRWVFVEASDGPSGIGGFASEAHILAGAASVSCAPRPVT